MSETEEVPDPFVKALHDERAQKNTRNVDCWACEAAQSAVIADLRHRLAESESAASHTHALLQRVVPDEERLLELWRDHWRDQLAIRRASPAPAPAGDSGGERG